MKQKPSINHKKPTFLEKTKSQITAFVIVCNSEGKIQEDVL